MELHPTEKTPSQKSFKDMNEDMLMCIQNCTQCAQTCEHLIQHCLKMGDAHANPSHITLLRDCVDICTLSASFMLRDSQMHHRSCAICAEICEECADDCENFPDDALMQNCVDTCRRCAESCQKMSLAH